MKRGSLILKNSGTGLAFQLVNMVFQFVCRKVFLDYLGVELLGLSSTFTSILNALSLAELGFQSAIVYSLYVPLNNGDTDTVNKVITIFKFVYRCVAIFMIVGSLCFLPFLKYVVKGVQWGVHVYIMFFLHAVSVSVSYCMAYGRSLLYADQRDYVAKFIDIGGSIVFGILEIAIIVCTKNYYAYLILRIIRVASSNLLVHRHCKKCYKYLSKTKIDREKAKEIFRNVKEIFIARIAGYVYSATDSLVISAFINTPSVGYLVNYTTVSNAVKSLAESMLKPIIPFIGRILNNENMQENDEKKMFDIYMYVRFLIACVVTIPLFILADEFVGFVFGSKYVLSKKISMFLCLEQYIYFSHGGASVFINGKGLFHKEKWVEIVGAISNIVVSILLAQSIGVPGVLIGTVFSQVLYAVGRVSIVFKHVLSEETGVLKYWARAIYQFATFLVAAFACTKLCYLVEFESPLIQFILRGIMAELIIVLICFISLCIDANHRKQIMLLCQRLKRRNS